MYSFIIFVIFTTLLANGSAHKLGKLYKFKDRCNPYVVINLLNMIFILFGILISSMIYTFPIIWSVLMTLISIPYLLCGTFYFSDNIIIFGNVEN